MWYCRVMTSRHQLRTVAQESRLADLLAWRLEPAGPLWRWLGTSRTAQSRHTVDISRDPLTAIAQVHRLRTEILPALEADLVVAGRKSGLSWRAVAAALDMTEQGARRRHPDADRRAWSRE
jgi:hypothetical protein